MISKRVTFSAAAALAAALALGGATVVPDAGAQGTSGEATVTVPVAPVRILDTRDGTGTGGLTTPIPTDGEVDLIVAGAVGVPADAVGVVLNVTVTDGSAKSFLTVYPSGTDRPKASVLNIEPGLNLPNMITAKLGTGGALRFYNYAGSVHVAADVAGYLIPASQFGGTPGPQGPPGPAGAQGPAGTATAWGRVNNQTPPGFVSRSPNVAAVYKSGSSGGFCITFTAPLPAERLAAAVASTNAYSFTAYPGDTTVPCQPGELTVLVMQGNMTAPVGFSFVIP